jgi:hypothetical protein
MNNMEFTAGHCNGKRTFPLLVRRGGSAQSFDFGHYHYAETGWLKQKPDGISTTSPKSMKMTDYPGQKIESHGFGYSS